MADDHVGFSITPKVDLSGFDKAVQLSNRFEEKLSKIDQGLSRLHTPSSLPREINHIDTVTASYVQRLESEGKHYQATQERVKAYKNAIKELSDKQKGLEHLLETSSQGIDKNSDSYRHLQIRANQNAAELNKFKDAVKQTNAEMRSNNPTFMDRIKSKLNGLQEKAEATHRSFKDIFMGSALGNMASNALGNLSGQFSGAIKRGMELNGAVGKINARFKAMGANDKEVGALDKQISSLKYNTNMTGDNVANLQARMQNWSRIGKQGAMQMTTAIAGIGDSSKMTGDDIERMSTGLMRVGASGKITLSSLNRITRTAPTFYAQLAKGAGMSQSHLKALLATGKVTQNQFQTWLADSAKYSSTAFKAFGQTQGGAIHQIKVRWDTVKAQLTKPLFDAKSSGLQSLKSILTSKEVTSGANAVGHAIANTVGYLDKHKQDISGIARDVVKIGVEIDKSVWKDFSGIVMDVGHALGLIHGHGSALHQFKVTLDGIAQNKGAIQLTAKAIIAIAAVRGLTHVGSGLLGIGSNAYGAYRKVKVFHDGLHGIQTVGKFTKGEGAFNSLGISISGVIGKLAKMKAAGQTLGGTGGKIFGAVGTGLIAGQQVVQAIKDRHNASARSKDIGGGIGAVAGGALASMIPVVGPMLAPVGALIGKYAGRWGGQAVHNFAKGWQAKKPPKSFWSMANLGWSTHNMFKQIGSGWNHLWAGMGDWRKKQAQGIGQWANSVGRGWNRGVKGVKTWFKNIPSNLGNAENHIKTWAGRVGNNIHRGWNKGIQASHNFFKNLPSNMSKAGRALQSGWNRTWEKINSNRYVKAFKKGQFMQTASKDIQSRWKSFSTEFGKSWNATWKKAQTSANKSWDKTKRNASNTWGHIQSGWKSFSTKFGKNWNASWNSFNNARYVKAFKKGEFFSTALKDIQSRWKSFSTDFGKKWNDFWGGLSKGWNNFWGGMGNWAKKGGNDIKGFGNDVNYAFGGSGKAFKYTNVKSHANGGVMYSTHAALVGEAGPELAYTPWGNHARILGANGPQLDKVHAGEKILNAHDTAKVMHGGLGYGLVLNGYANGTTNLRQTSRNVTSSYKKITNDATKSLRSLTRNNNSSWSKIKSGTTKLLRSLTRSNNSSWLKIKAGATKQVTGLARTNNSTWTRIAKQTRKQTDRTRHDAVSDYTGMCKGVNKQMDSLHDGVIKLASTTSKGFGKELGRMKDYAHSAMSGTIDQINKGISGIDKVLGQFGGNTSVIKPVKFATGTDANGRLTQNTYAMVNDATSGPRQEALVSDKNEIFMPRGSNVTMMIPKGWGVLNGKQTQQAGLQHFAKGTGLSYSALRKLAEKAGANPTQSFKSMYLSNIKPSGSDLKRGSDGLASNSSTHFGNLWSNAMWTVINNAIGSADGNGGTREAFLKYAESTFSGVPYIMGAMSKVASDCSGMVAQALRHFGIDAGRSTVDMQHSSALQYLGKSISHTIPGDLVIFGHGTGAAGHVGIVKNPETGTMFNETPPHARVTDIASDMGMGYGFYRVKGLHNALTSKKTVKADKRLEALARHELGSSALKWIKDKLGDEGMLGGNIGGEGVKRWAGTVKRILGMLHLSTSSSMVNRVLRQINTESGGNPNARQAGADPDGDGSGPALGLMQTKRMTYDAFKRKGSGGIFNGPSNIYAALNYAMHRYGPSLSALGNGHGYAKGGDPRVGDTVMVGEDGPELAKFNSPVHVYSNEQSRKLDFTDLLNRKPVKQTNSSQPVINININGNISSVAEANRVSDIVARKIEQVLDGIADNWGTEPDAY